jgi:hypothetical protein
LVLFENRPTATLRFSVGTLGNTVAGVATGGGAKTATGCGAGVAHPERKTVTTKPKRATNLKFILPSSPNLDMKWRFQITQASSLWRHS